VTVSPPAGAETALERDVRALVQRVVASSQRFGRPDLSTAVLRGLERLDDVDIGIVVAGQTKSGKSALVNALLGRPQLSPIDHELATSVHVVVRYASPEFVRVLLHDGAELTIPAAEIAEWVTAGRNPGNEKGVSAVEVGIDHPLLQSGLRIIDTPGVGGLSETHNEITLLALELGDALLFVSDLGAPLSAPEIAFLRQAAERVPSVILAFTKADLYPGWQTILDESRRVLVEHVPELASAPHFVLRSRDKTAGDELSLTDGERAERLVARSGYPELESHLAGVVVARAKALRLKNILAVAKRALTQVGSQPYLRHAAARGNEALKGELEQELARVARFAQAKTWPAKLTEQLELIRLEVVASVDAAVDRLTGHYLQRITTEKDSPDFAQHLETDLDALLVQIGRDLDARIAELVAELIRPLGEANLQPRTLPESAARTWVNRELVDVSGDNLSATEMLSEAGNSIIYGANAWTSVMDKLGYATRFAFLGAAAGPVGLAAGVVIAGVSVVTKQLSTAEKQQIQRTRNEAAAFVNANMAAGRRVITTEVQKRLVVARSAIPEAINEYVQQRAKELQDAVAEQKQLLDADEAERQRALAAAEQALTPLRELAQRLDGLMAIVDRLLGGERNGATSGAESVPTTETAT
jgi:hypothetical protein